MSRVRGNFHARFLEGKAVVIPLTYSTGEAGKQTSEVDVAGTVADESDISFTVRYCKKASVIDSTGYRVVFGGGIYDIVAVDHMNYKKKCIKFKCRKARR